MIRSLAAGFWAVLADMSPYLLLGFFFAGVLHVFINEDKVRRHLGGGGIWPVLKAALFGVPMPLCSCGVIPVAASLRRQGASRGATMAFLLSTPQTGVDSILATWGLLGGAFAIFRPLAALLTGIAGGYWAQAADSGDPPDEPAPEADNCCSCGSHREGGSIWARLVDAVRYGFVVLPRDMAGTLLVGLVLASAITAAMPQDLLPRILGHGILPMLLMMLAGIPVYVCATGSIPIAAALIAKGLSPGAALVFLVTGPATNAATIATVWKVLGRKAAAIYLATVALSALACGLLFDKLIAATGATVCHADSMSLPAPVKNIAALLMLAMLAAAFFGGKRGKGAGEGEKTSA